MSVAPQTSGNAPAARSSLHLGSGGYGLLLGCVGVGAVAGALLLPRLRTLLRAVGGLAWVLALSTLSSAYQLTLPGWAKARGMSFYLIAFQGGNAVGSAVLGVLAQHAGLTATFVTAAVALALGPLLGLRFPFQAIPPDELRPAGDWPAPPAPSDTAQPAGPVMVSVEYRPRAGQRGAMLAALRDTRFSRRRTGATSWRLWQDAAEPGRIVEQFVVASWDEHLRQHDRVTHRDVGRLEQVRALTDPDHPPVVTHWLTPGPDRTSAAP